LLLGLVVTTSAIAVLIECVFVPMSIIRLFKYPHLRTAENVWCIVFGATFPLLMLAIAAVLRLL
jgi:hypothetical protein